MIIDSLTNCNLYSGFCPNIKKGFEFLIKNNDLNALPIGKIEIDGDNLYALIQEYRPKEFNPLMWEAHKKYYDLQYMLSSIEKIAVSNIKNIESRTEYNSVEDYWLFKGALSDSITLAQGQFVIFNPEDVHQPGLILENNGEIVKKIVVKAKIHS